MVWLSVSDSEEKPEGLAASNWKRLKKEVADWEEYGSGSPRDGCALTSGSWVVHGSCQEKVGSEAGVRALERGPTAPGGGGKETQVHLLCHQPLILSHF